MDVLRSCYSTTMIFEIGGTPIPIRWYRCASNAKAFPGDHAFFSKDWEDDKGNDRLGEQRPPRGIWDAGMRPAALRGDGHYQGSAEDFQEGVSPGFTSAEKLSVALEPETCVCGEGPFDAPPGPEEAFPVWHTQCGGLRWADNIFPPKEPCKVCVDCGSYPGDPLCDCCLPQILKAIFYTSGGGSCLDEFSVTLIRGPNQDCEWSGVAETPCVPGTPVYFELINALRPPDGDWVIQFGYNPLILDGGQDTQDAGSCKPLGLVFNNIIPIAGWPVSGISCVVQRA